MPLPNTAKRILSILLAFVLVVAGTVISANASYQSQIDELEKKQAALKVKIDALQEDIDQQEGLKSALQERIDVVQKQIDLYNSQIDKIQDKIDQKNEEKAAIEAKLEENKQTFLARIRAMYMAGSNSSVTVLLGADDFADYLYQSELLASVTEYDNKVMDKMRDDIVAIERLEAEMKQEQEGILSLRSVVDEKRAELGNDMKALNSVISSLESKQGALERDVADYQKQIEELEAKIKAAADKAKFENVKFDGSQFLWPCPGYYYISSNYGYRWGRLHKGVDIAGSNIYGKPIVAAADGVVSLVDYNGGGYGYYVMVNHGNNGGNNYVTLYAHMSRQAARVGQTVKAGDTIGYVGSTGFSTGPHLHFEIRVNGTAQNPMNFFSSVG